MVRVTVLTDSRLVVNLPGDGAWLRQNRAAGLGIGIGVLRLSLIEEADAQGIHRDAERVVVAALGIPVPVRMLWRFEVRRLGVDRRHVSALPLPRGRRTQCE